ncbi:5-oxoprolinase subunit C family protein [Ekhidna sp.]
MGKLKVIKTGPAASIQDFGRFGVRRYGIPQSGAMDINMMILANKLVGNEEDFPVIEFAMMGSKMEALEESIVSVVGAESMLNGKKMSNKSFEMVPGDQLEVSTPAAVYGYIALAGKIQSKVDFDSSSTYPPAKFGGINGAPLKAGDILESKGDGRSKKEYDHPEIRPEPDVEITIMKGPEWEYLKELPSNKTFVIDSSSNRMGIRLIGELQCDYREIKSSAVVPGIIQLPPNGQPIVLMNDCQTTGGYPRIAKVIKEDLGKLAQVKAGGKISFNTI